MGMCAFAMPGLQASKYKCCFNNLQYSCSVAKSRVGNLPPTAFRIKSKLLSMPYQPSSDGFISCHAPPSPCPLPSPSTPRPTYPHSASFTLGFWFSFRHTVLFYDSTLPICYSLCLQCPSPLLYSERHCWSLEDQFMQNFHCEVFLIPRLEYLLLSLLSPFLFNVHIVLELFIYLTFLIGLYSPQSQGSYLAQHPLLCLAHSRYLVIIIANFTEKPYNMLFVCVLHAFVCIFSFYPHNDFLM